VKLCPFPPLIEMPLDKAQAAGDHGRRCGSVSRSPVSHSANENPPPRRVSEADASRVLRGRDVRQSRLTTSPAFQTYFSARDQLLEAMTLENAARRLRICRESSRMTCTRSWMWPCQPSPTRDRRRRIASLEEVTPLDAAEPGSVPKPAGLTHTPFWRECVVVRSPLVKAVIVAISMNRSK